MGFRIPWAVFFNSKDQDLGFRIPHIKLDFETHKQKIPRIQIPSHDASCMVLIPT